VFKAFYHTPYHAITPKWVVGCWLFLGLLRPEQPTTNVYLPYVSTANAAATIIQHAYTKYINHVIPQHHHHVTINALTQLDDIYNIIQRAVERAVNNIVNDNRLLDDNG